MSLSGEDEVADVGEDFGGDGLGDCGVFVAVAGGGVLHEMVEPGVGLDLRGGECPACRFTVERRWYLGVFLSVDYECRYLQSAHVFGRVVVQKPDHPVVRRLLHH